MTAAERAAWAAAGALATLAALAGLAAHWARAVERNERYGTHMVQGERRRTELRAADAPVARY